MNVNTVRIELKKIHITINSLRKQLTPYTKWKQQSKDGNTLQLIPKRWCRGESNQKKISFETSHEFGSLFCAHRLWPTRAAGAGAATNFQLINEATAAREGTVEGLQEKAQAPQNPQEAPTTAGHRDYAEAPGGVRLLGGATAIRAN